MGAQHMVQKPLKNRDVLDATFARLERFVTTRQRRMLVAVADDDARATVMDLLAGDDVAIRAETSGSAALAGRSSASTAPRSRRRAR